MPWLPVLLATCAGLAAAMYGGVELTQKFDYFVYFLTGDKTDAFYHFNDTTKKPNANWVYCMGVLYDALTVLTAEMCRVEPDGMHWVGGYEANVFEGHPVKSVIRGRHALDFRVVKPRGSPIGGPLGEAHRSLMVRVDEARLKELATKKTKGIVTTVSSPHKIGAMMMLSLDECSKKYFNLLLKFPRSTALMPDLLPTSVFCAVQSPEAFDLKRSNRFRRQATTAVNNVTATTSASPSVKPTASPVNIGPVAPGLACPDSLGSPFIISGGQVLGILVAADCRSGNISFFQSLVDDLPVPERDLNADSQRRTFWPPPPTNQTPWVWKPKGPRAKGVTLKPVGWQGGARAELAPFGAANTFKPSMLVISMSLCYGLYAKGKLRLPEK